MAKPLSPAQAVLARVTQALYGLDPDEIPTNEAARIASVIAPAIRALADQAGSARHWHVDQLRAIACHWDETWPDCHAWPVPPWGKGDSADESWRDFAAFEDWFSGQVEARNLDGHDFTINDRIEMYAMMINVFFAGVDAGRNPWRCAQQPSKTTTISSPDNPGCLVAPGCRPPTPTIRAVQSGDFSDPAIWSTSTQEAQ